MGGVARARGQATVELALALPFLTAALLLVVQVLVVARAQLVVQHAAREAARAAAGDPDEAAAVRAASSGGLGGPATDIRVRPTGTGEVTVTVTHRVATVVPLVGALVPDVTVAGAATFRVEWDPP